MKYRFSDTPLRHRAIWEARRQKYHAQQRHIHILLRTMTRKEAASALGMSIGNLYRIMRTVIRPPEHA